MPDDTHLGRTAHRCSSTTTAEVRHGGQHGNGLDLVIELPEGWRPPSQAASTLLRVLVDIHERRRRKDAA